VPRELGCSIATVADARKTPARLAGWRRSKSNSTEVGRPQANANLTLTEHGARCVARAMAVGENRERIPLRRLQSASQQRRTPPCVVPVSGIDRHQSLHAERLDEPGHVAPTRSTGTLPSAEISIAACRGEAPDTRPDQILAATPSRLRYRPFSRSRSTQPLSVAGKAYMARTGHPCGEPTQRASVMERAPCGDPRRRALPCGRPSRRAACETAGP
jgi:hypothetical protein